MNYRISIAIFLTAFGLFNCLVSIFTPDVDHHVLAILTAASGTGALFFLVFDLLDS